MKKVDYIVVGQGLAGSLLAWRLLRAGKRVCIVNSSVLPAASAVAAGMYNPLVFKRLTKSWMVDELLPVMRAVYSEIENELKIQLLQDLPIKKLLNEEEYIFWVKKEAGGKLRPYLRSVSRENHIKGLQSFAGVGEVTGGGYLHIGNLLKHIKAYLMNFASYETKGFNYDDLQLTADSVLWKNYSAGRVVFCEGAQAVSNPFFNWVPFYLTKGDILKVQIDFFKEESVLSKQVFLLPNGNGIYTVGSTYNWSGLDYSLNNSDRQHLEDKLQKIISLPYIVLDHITGVRPTIKDRRPVLGKHPVYPQLTYFNGLGTKGVMLAPYFSKQMVSYLEKQTELTPEVNIKRFV